MNSNISHGIVNKAFIATCDKYMFEIHECQNVWPHHFYMKFVNSVRKLSGMNLHSMSELLTYISQYKTPLGDVIDKDSENTIPYMIINNKGLYLKAEHNPTALSI